MAIDDFGSEYSSLAYLKRFPATILKIDKSFVDGLVEPDSPDATLIATIVAMARALGITTVAEGVETQAQAETPDRARLRRRSGVSVLATRGRRPAPRSRGVARHPAAAARDRLRAAALRV
jgi:sensor c-di-GMP phosphodiesterase-like protein